MDSQGVQRLSRAVRDGLRGVLRLQRHGGQLAGARLALPVLSQRDLLIFGACRNRRMRRAGILFQRLEAARGALADGQADAGSGALARQAAGPTSTSPNPAWSRSPSRPRPGRSIRWRRSARCRTSVGRLASNCTWMALASPRRVRRLAALRRTSHGARAWTCCASAAPRMVWQSARRSSSSTPRWRRTLTIAASRRGSSPPKCASSPPPGSECWRAAHGSATRGTPTPAPPGSPRRSKGLPGVELMFPVQANAVFLARARAAPGGAAPAKLAILHLHRGGARFMFAWDSDVERVDRLAQDIREASLLS